MSIGLFNGLDKEFCREDFYRKCLKLCVKLTEEIEDENEPIYLEEYRKFCLKSPTYVKNNVIDSYFIDEGIFPDGKERRMVYSLNADYYENGRLKRG